MGPEVYRRSPHARGAWLAVACLCALCALAACGDSGAGQAQREREPDPRAADAERAALDAAERYVSSGDPDSARTIVQRLLERGESAEALDILARCELLRAEDAVQDEVASAARAAAAEAYRRASAAAPADPALAARAAMSADQAGLAPQSIPLYRRALELDAASVQLRVFLGFALAREGQLAEAERIFAQAAALAPDSPWPVAGLSACALRAGDAARALELARSARALAPDDLSIRVAESQALRASGGASDALSLMLALEPARRLTPEAVAEIALCHEALGHPEDAARAWEELAQSASATRHAALEAARWWDIVGDAEQSRSWRTTAAGLPRTPRPARP
jgi:tetratricopeptide (TPR) repeat protein